MTPRTIRFWQAMTLRTNFRHYAWRVTAQEGRTLLVLATVADLLAQWWLGEPNLMTLIAAVALPCLFWRLPGRLAAGAGGVLLVQSLGSMVVILAATLVGLPRFFVEGAALAWWFYCITALVLLGLSYFRTPKSQMP